MKKVQHHNLDCHYDNDHHHYLIGSGWLEVPDQEGPLVLHLWSPLKIGHVDNNPLRIGDNPRYPWELVMSIIILDNNLWNTLIIGDIGMVIVSPELASDVETCGRPSPEHQVSWEKEFSSILIVFGVFIIFYFIFDIWQCFIPHFIKYCTCSWWLNYQQGRSW